MSTAAAPEATSVTRRRRRLRKLRRLATAPLALAAALILAFEEWLWDPLAALMLWLGHRPPVSWIEAGIRALPGAAAVVAFLVPVLALLPIKLAAVPLIAAGHAVAGFALLGAAKIVGTALIAWIWRLTSPKLLAIGWFARMHARFLTIKTALYSAVFDHPLLIALRRKARRLREQWRRRRRARRRA